MTRGEKKEKTSCDIQPQSMATPSPWVPTGMALIATEHQECYVQVRGGGMKSKEHWNITVQHSPQFFCNIYLECQNFHYNMARGTSNKPQNSDADFMSFNKKHKNPVFFHCFYFITKNKSFINASTCNLKAVIIVMNYLPCGFRCAGAAWRFDLVRLCWHSADGKFYLGKRRKYANDSGKDKLCILWFNNIGLFLEKQQDYSPLCFRVNSARN